MPRAWALCSWWVQDRDPRREVFCVAREPFHQVYHSMWKSHAVHNTHLLCLTAHWHSLTSPKISAFVCIWLSSRFRTWVSPLRFWISEPREIWSLWKQWKFSSRALKTNSKKWKMATRATLPDSTRYLTDSDVIPSGHMIGRACFRLLCDIFEFTGKKLCVQVCHKSEICNWKHQRV